MRKWPSRCWLACLFGLALLASACADGDSGDASAAEDADGSEVVGGDGQCGDWLDGRTGDFVVPYNPGGSTDPVGREYVAALEETLGQQWTVENVAGGGASIGTAQTLGGEPDGSVLGLSSNSAMLFQPLVNTDVPYDGLDDMQLVVKLVDLPAVLAVADDAPWDTVEEFLDDAEQRPGEVTVATSGNLTQPDQNVLVLNDLAGLELRNVPFTGGGGEALTAVLAGQADATLGYGPSLQGQIDAGELRPLAVVAEDSYHLFPDLPTFAELGYDVTTPAWYGIVAPPDIDQQLLDCIRDASMDAITTDTFEQWALDMGYNHDPVRGNDAITELETIADEYQTIADQHADQIDAPTATLDNENDD